jgi:uncharacterized protein
VTDLTGTLYPGDIEQLRDVLSAFEQQTSNQIVVLMVPTLGGEPIEEVSYDIARKNAIGQKGKDNGVLVLIAKDDRQVRIEVGYGLEGVLPDILAGQIIRKEMIPHFKDDDYAAGIRAAIDAIILATKHEYKAETPARRPSRGAPSLIWILFVIAFIVLRFMRRGLGGGGFWWGGFGGGGFGGGGFGSGGGFSGGGGSFGGGGASGRW